MTLDDVQADAFRRLSQGVADRNSPFRSPAFGTVASDGRPAVRTVVLRAFDPATRIVTVHSDVRANKINEIAANPAITLHVWDEAAQVQVRLDGQASVLTGLAVRAEWDKLHPGSRATYAVRPHPRTPLADPASADADRLDEAAAFVNFAVIRVGLTGLDWLHLARDGHRRAMFAWDGGEVSGRWVVP